MIFYSFLLLNSAMIRIIAYFFRVIYYLFLFLTLFLSFVSPLLLCRFCSCLGSLSRFVDLSLLDIPTKIKRLLRIVGY